MSWFERLLGKAGSSLGMENMNPFPLNYLILKLEAFRKTYETRNKSSLLVCVCITKQTNNNGNNNKQEQETQ